MAKKKYEAEVEGITRDFDNAVEVEMEKEMEKTPMMKIGTTNKIMTKMRTRRARTRIMSEEKRTVVMERRSRY